jgi:hypothetical protein
VPQLVAAPALNLMFNKGGLSKMSQTKQFLTFLTQFYRYSANLNKKSWEKFALTGLLILACFNF